MPRTQKVLSAVIWAQYTCDAFAMNPDEESGAGQDPSSVPTESGRLPECMLSVTEEGVQQCVIPLNPFRFILNHLGYGR